MQGFRVLLAIVMCGAGLVAVHGGDRALAGGSGGMAWEYHETAGGYVHPPVRGEYPGDDGRPAEPDKNGYFYKTEPGNTRNFRGEYTWWCNAPVPARQGTGDTRDGRCDDLVRGISSRFSCAGLWPPDERPAIPYATLRQKTDWIDGWKRGDGPSEDAAWDFVKVECKPLADKDWIPDEYLRDEVDREVLKRFRSPNMGFSPSRRSLTTLPTIVWTDYPARGPLPPGVRLVTVDGKKAIIEADVDIDRGGEHLRGVIRATAEFRWDFGEAGTGLGRGRRYTPGVSPRTNPDNYYVTATYLKKGDGISHLSITWTGDVFVDTLPPEKLLPIKLPLVRCKVQVLDSRPVLTGQ